MVKKLWLSLILAIGLLLPIAHSPVNHIPVFTSTILYAYDTLVVTGATDPVAVNGTYIYYGEYGGYPEYKNTIADYWILYGYSAGYYIFDFSDESGANLFDNAAASPSPFGSYTPYMGSGNVVVVLRGINITPNYGKLSGGTAIVITDGDFTAGDTITIDGNLCTNVSVDSPVQISGITPAGTAGIKDVYVFHEGVSGDSVAFTYTDLLTGYIDPIGDVSAGWGATQPTPPTTHYTKIDDGIRQPNVPDKTDYNYAWWGGAQPQVDTFYMSTIPSVGSISKITIWMYGNWSTYAGEISVSIYMGGGWVTPSNMGLTDTTRWYGVPFSGTWTQTDLDNIQVTLSATTIGWDNNYATYGEVTYADTVGGGGEEPPATRAYFIKKKKGITFIK